MRAKPVSYALLACAVAALLCAFLPWAQAGLFTVAGTSGDGALTAGVAILIGVAAIAAATNNSPRICGALAVLPGCGIAWVGVNDTIALGEHAAIGVIGTAFTGVAAATTALILAFAEPEPSTAAQRDTRATCNAEMSCWCAPCICLAFQYSPQQISTVWRTKSTTSRASYHSMDVLQHVS